jgi:hypothetical protein
MARSTQPFSVEKAARQQTVEVPVSSVVESGDGISTREGMVQIQFSEGDTLLVDRESSARVLSENEISLEKGNLMASSQGEAARNFQYRGLRLEQVGEPNGDNPAVLLMSEVEPGTVRVAGLNGSYAVSSPSEGEQIAFIGSGDALQFRQVQDKWILQSQELQTPFQSPLDVSQGALTEDVEKAFILWWSAPVAIVAGGAGYGTYLLVQNLNDDDGDDDDDDDDGEDDDREYFSPVYSTN